MATEMDACAKALGTHVLESFKDFVHDLSKEEGVEDVSIIPLRKYGDFSSTAMSFSRKGDEQDSSIEFICTDTGAVTVAMFVRGVPIDGVKVPAILTREDVDAIVERFVRTAFK